MLENDTIKYARSICPECQDDFMAVTKTIKKISRLTKRITRKDTVIYAHFCRQTKSLWKTRHYLINNNLTEGTL